jgi:hypothetical protein
LKLSIRDPEEGGRTDNSFDLVKFYTPRKTLLGEKADLGDDELVELLTVSGD